MFYNSWVDNAYLRVSMVAIRSVQTTAVIGVITDRVSLKSCSHSLTLPLYGERRNIAVR